MAEPIVIATWPFGQAAARTALTMLEAGRPALDAVIGGAQAVEDDPKVMWVGYGGLPNALGTVQLDACVMDGRTMSCGGVAAVENVVHVAALARRVMEKTPNVLLVGEGARLFAVEQGFPLQSLSTPESLAEWQRMRPIPQSPTNVREKGHDTVTVLALDRKGTLGGACSTSGLPHKLPGRVGDSPLIGSGLYVDDTAGAAGATGVGEEIIRIGGSHLIVETMRAGRSAQEACEFAVRRVNQLAVRRGVHPAQVSFLALDAKGRPGAACTAGANFEYAVGRGSNVQLVKAKALEPDKP